MVDILTLKLNHFILYFFRKRSRCQKSIKLSSLCSALWRRLQPMPSLPTNTSQVSTYLYTDNNNNDNMKSIFHIGLRFIDHVLNCDTRNTLMINDSDNEDNNITSPIKGESILMRKCRQSQRCSFSYGIYRRLGFYQQKNSMAK